MTIGNLFAIRQQNLKRFLAFSSISQAGYILLGLIGGNELGMASVIYYILVYIFSNLGAFGVVIAISNQTGKENMDDYNGLYHTNPKLSLIMTLALVFTCRDTSGCRILRKVLPVHGSCTKRFLPAGAYCSSQYNHIIVLLSAGCKSNVHKQIGISN